MRGNRAVNQKKEFKQMQEISENALKSGVEQVVAPIALRHSVTAFSFSNANTQHGSDDINCVNSSKNGLPL